MKAVDLAPFAQRDHAKPRVQSAPVGVCLHRLHEGESSPFCPRKVALIFALTGLMGIANSWRGLYVDEYITWWVARLPTEELLENRFSSGHMPGYFLALSLWMRLAGDSEWGLRFPSLLMVLGSLAVLMVLVRDWYSASVAYWAGWFFSLHQLALWTSQTARPYAALLLFTLLGVWGLCRWIQRGGWGWIALAGVSSILGMATQPLHAVVVVTLCLGALLHAPQKLQRALVAIVILVVTALITLQLFVALTTKQRYFHEYRFTWYLDRLPTVISRVYAGDFRFLWRNSTLEIVVLILMGLHLIGFARTRPRDLSMARSFVGVWITTTLIVLLVMQGFGTKSILVHTRYYVPILPAFLVIAAVGASYWHDRWESLWGARIIIVGHIVLMAMISGAWLMQKGDGPQLFARSLEGPTMLLTNGYQQFYEYRNRPEIEVANITPEDALDRLSQAVHRGHKTVWIAIYDNHRNPMHALLREPPADWRLVEARAMLHIQAAKLEYIGESLPEETP